jgi:alpha-beta hydrolase superfamily lysophospholipase
LQVDEGRKMSIEIISMTPESVSKKTPILFVHGAWHAAWCWDEHFLSYFYKRGYPAYALSLSNHGKTKGKKRLNFTLISDYLKDLAETVKTFDKKPIVIGHSMGGLVVQKYLEKNSLPAAVLLTSIPPRGILRLTLKICRENFKEFLLANLTWNLHRIIGTEKLAKKWLFSPDMPDHKVSKYFNKLQSESYFAFLLGMLFPRIKHKKQASVPMLVLGAENDAIFTVDEVEATAKMHNAEFKVIPGIAHDIMLESKWKEVADIIIQWLEKL